jgi:hypothetical protein
MGSLSAGMLDWMRQEGPPNFRMDPDFENRMYRQFGQLMQRQQQTQARQLTEAFARKGKTGSPQHQSEMLALMYGGQGTLGDMISRSAIQNALRRLQEEQTLGQYQLGMLGTIGNISTHPLPGYVPKGPKSRSGLKAAFGNFMGDLGGLLGEWAGNEWGTGGATSQSAPRMDTLASAGLKYGAMM